MSTVADMEVRVTADIKDLQRKMDNAGGSVAKLGQQFKPLVTGSNSAAFALQNMGRVAQDIPFGFIGIQNNLNPLLESFQRLRAETGSNKAALKALGSSLMGAGGLGFALSIASTAFLIYENGIMNFSKKTNEAKKNVEDFANVVKGIFKEAAQEAAQVQSLIVILDSETESRKRKLEALQELKKIQPEIFNGLKLEGDAVIGLDAAYQQYILNLKTVIAVKIKQQQLEKTTQQILEKEGATLTRQERLLKEGAKNLRGRIKDQLFIRSQNEKDKKSQEEINELYKDQKFLLDDINDLSKGIKTNPLKDLKSGAKKDIETIADVIAKMNAAIEVLNKKEILFKTDEAKSKISEIESAIDTLFAKFKLGADNELILNLNTRINIINLEQRVKEYFKGQKEIEAPIEIIIDPILTDGSSPMNGLKLFNESDFDRQKMEAYLLSLGITKGFQDGLDVGIAGLRFPQLTELFESAKQQAEYFKSLSEGVMLSLAESFGSAIAGFAQGGKGLSQVFEGVLGLMGQYLIDLGKAAVLTSKLFIALKGAGKNPFTGIVAGIAAIAAGYILKSVKLPAFATGVENFAGGLAVVGERGPELVNLPRGSDVIPNRAIGGMSGAPIHVTVAGSFRGQGSELLYVIDQATARRGRTR